MKNLLIILVISTALLTCKEKDKKVAPDPPNKIENTFTKTPDSITALPKNNNVITAPKTKEQIKKELKLRGFKTYNYVDKETKDTILVQQYFMAILKRGSIRGLNEEEEEELQEFHIAHLKKMYELGYVDIAGALGNDGYYGGVTIYNVPTLKMADSLAKTNPMVASGRLEIKIHPWWAPKGYHLR